MDGVNVFPADIAALKLRPISSAVYRQNPLIAAGALKESNVDARIVVNDVWWRAAICDVVIVDAKQWLSHLSSRIFS
jgi:hypothetical protein